MRSIKHCPYPREDALLDILTTDYEFIADEYVTAWKFRQFLKNLRMCDYSDILDDIYYARGIVMCRRVIFFSCMPRDVDRMTFVLERIGGAASIADDEGEVIYGRLF